MAATNAALAEAKQSMLAVSKLLKDDGDTKGAHHAACMATGIEDNETVMVSLVEDYSHFLDDMRSQAARILRMAIDKNDITVQ